MVAQSATRHEYGSTAPRSETAPRAAITATRRGSEGADSARGRPQGAPLSSHRGLPKRRMPRQASVAVASAVSQASPLAPYVTPFPTATRSAPAAITPRIGRRTRMGRGEDMVRSSTDDKGDLIVSSRPPSRLITAAHRNPQTKWTANDVVDIDALSVAVPSCDVVVTEPHARSTLLAGA